MQFSALSPFFIIKIEKEIQKDTREKDGYFYTHSDHVFMQREVQHGEIVSIGEDAKELFPEAKEGHTLIFHHFVTGEDGEESKCLIYSDERYNYYSVTVKSHKGEKNLSYGVWDGEKIIPHKQYVFLNISNVEIEIVKTELGILSIEGFTETKDELGLKMKEIKSSINELTKAKVSNEVSQEIVKRETEMNRISKRVNKKQILLYPVAYVSDYIKSLFNQPFSQLGFMNIACHTKVFFNNTEYIVSDIKYLSCASK